MVLFSYSIPGLLLMYVLNAKKKPKCINFILPNVRKLDCDMVLDSNMLDFVDDTVFLGYRL